MGIGRRPFSAKYKSLLSATFGTSIFESVIEILSANDESLYLLLQQHSLTASTQFVYQLEGSSVSKHWLKGPGKVWECIS